MLKNSIYVSLVLTIFYACRDYDKAIHIDKKGIEITLPGFVKEDELADDAFIEYANRFRNFYIAVFEIKTNLSQDSLWYKTTQRVSSPLIHLKIDSFINGNTITTIIKGNFKDEKEQIIYSQKLIYNSDKSYLLTIWTRGDERFKKYEQTIADINASFKIKE